MIKSWSLIHWLYTLYYKFAEKQNLPSQSPVFSNECVEILYEGLKWWDQDKEEPHVLL